MVFVRRHARHWRAYLAGGGLVLEKHWKLCLAAIFAVLLVCWVVDASKVFKDCEHNYKHDQRYHAANQGHSVVEVAKKMLVLHTACVGQFADGNRDNLTLLATFVVAAFTGTLWLSTHLLWKEAETQRTSAEEARKADVVHLGESLQTAKAAADASLMAAQAAQKQAEIADRALSGLERPYIFLGGLNANILPNQGFEDLPQTALVSFPEVNYSLDNIGRSPGFIYGISIELLITDILPDVPEYRSEAYIHAERIMPVGRTGLAQITALDRWIKQDEMIDIMAGKLTIFLIGYIDYTDVAAARFRTGFGLSYIPDRNAFAAVQASGYNYRH